MLSTLARVLRIFWNFFKQLGVMLADILVVVLSVAAISILVKYLGKAMILVLPLVVLAAGWLLLTLARARRRAKDKRDRALVEQAQGRKA